MQNSTEIRTQHRVRDPADHDSLFTIPSLYCHASVVILPACPVTCGATRETREGAGDVTARDNLRVSLLQVGRWEATQRICARLPYAPIAVGHDLPFPT